MLALAEAVPDIFADTDPELRRVGAVVNGAAAGKAVAAALHGFEQAVSVEHLLHGHG